LAPKTPPSDGDDAREATLTRRDFLKTAGATAVATGMIGAASTPVSTPVIRGPGPFPLILEVNGTARTLTVEPRVTLLDALRDTLGLTGAKPVCDRGSCGACTVLVGDDPVAACMMLAADAEGRKITTVEGLGTPDALSPLQAAFVERDALQCGYCTPGFVVAATALLRKTPNPTPEQIRAGLTGNLCRCGTYGRIFEAVAQAAKKG
jgi:aerobic-type carbon monoxide dehydrogenase small subunit (CoxS/CutS family)